MKLVLEHQKINLTMNIINEEKFEFSWDDIDDEDYDTKDSPAKYAT